MTKALSTLAIGLFATFAVIVGQFVMPFAFDFVSTLAVYGAGVFVGRSTTS